MVYPASFLTTVEQMGKIIHVNEFILFTRLEEELSTLFLKDAHTGHAQ